MQLQSVRRPVRLVVATVLAASVLVVGQSATPAPVSADVSDGWVNIDVGGRHTCGVTTAGEAFCWGNGNEGQLGDGTTETVLFQMVPLEVPAPAGVLWASANVGEYHSCALTRPARSATATTRRPTSTRTRNSWFAPPVSPGTASPPATAEPVL